MSTSSLTTHFNTTRIRRKSFRISYDLAMIDKMTGFEFEEFISKLQKEKSR